MLIRRPILEAIKAGTVTLAFRTWRRPTVKAGGTLQTSVGLLAIDRMDAVDMDEITAEDARAAGYEGLEVLRHDLRQREGRIYRIALRYAGPDPRIGLRADTDLSLEDRNTIRRRLERLDGGEAGPWTWRTLALIADHPGRPAADLAARLGFEKAPFKTNVRKLKAMGLTESLETGYRLSPRGKAVLETFDNI